MVRKAKEFITRTFIMAILLTTAIITLGIIMFLVPAIIVLYANLSGVLEMAAIFGWMILAFSAVAALGDMMT